jgi:hypothetical protein
MSKNPAPIREQHAAFPISATRAPAGFRPGHQPPVLRSASRVREGSTIGHLPISFSFPWAGASHKRSAHIYVTLHDLHDSNGNENRPKTEFSRQDAKLAKKKS